MRKRISRLNTILMDSWAVIALAGCIATAERSSFIVSAHPSSDCHDSTFLLQTELHVHADLKNDVTVLRSWPVLNSTTSDTVADGEAHRGTTTFGKDDWRREQAEFRREDEQPQRGKVELRQRNDMPSAIDDETKDSKDYNAQSVLDGVEDNSSIYRAVAQPNREHLITPSLLNHVFVTSILFVILLLGLRSSKGNFAVALILLCCFGLANAWILRKRGSLGSNAETTVQCVSLGAILIAIFVAMRYIIDDKIEKLRLEFENRFEKKSKPKTSTQSSPLRSCLPWCFPQKDSGAASNLLAKAGDEPIAIPDPWISEQKPLQCTESPPKTINMKFKINEVIGKVRSMDWVEPVVTHGGFVGTKVLEKVPGKTCTVTGSKQTSVGAVTPKSTYSLVEEKSKIIITSRTITPDAPVKGFIIETVVEITEQDDATVASQVTKAVWLQTPGWLKSIVETSAIDEAQGGFDFMMESIQ